jgi:hypothetical protein
VAASSTISALRPQHRAARLDYATPFQDGLALDWNNGQVINGASSSVFDANRDVVVLVSGGGNSSCVGFWITVGPSASLPGGGAGATAGSQWIGANQRPTGVYVPAGQVINCAQVGSGGLLSCIPALTASNA